ncbi:hypothetical protein BaRGS_00038384, partial [Batillaria attramentaria]
RLSPITTAVYRKQYCLPTSLHLSPTTVTRLAYVLPCPLKPGFEPMCHRSQCRVKLLALSAQVA